MPRAYYNENDPKAAAWLRALIEAGLIMAGEVDNRSIVDVTGQDLKGYDRCHFFAGIGGWDYALQLAGWTGPVWTGSCPCQPFSSAGKGKGTDDKRHLWPEFARLIGECRPATVFGEQVASKAGREWFDGVSTDLEDMGYAAAAADLCAAGVGAPHIRQRLFWVADSDQSRQPAVGGNNAGQAGRHDGWCSQNSIGVADARIEGSHANALVRVCPGEEGSRTRDVQPERRSGLGDADIERREQAGHQQSRSDREAVSVGEAVWPGYSGPWHNFEVVRCVEPTKEPGRFVEKGRRVEPGLVPLAHGIPGRVAQLRGLGNAIVPQVAAEFIGAFLDAKQQG